tara:strand:+ start:16019 stop:17518 length:1500 start_codon:yes stop_codon:yes gene_type:complete
MKNKFLISVVAIIFSYFLIGNSYATEDITAVCDGPYAKKQLSQESLDQLLKENHPHQPINLCQANLDNLILSNQDLSGFNFDGASLRFTNLSYADLTETSFKRSVFIESNLRYAYARWSNFNHSIFLKSNLEYANFSNSTLQDVTMKSILLKNTNLSHTDLSHATIQLSNLEQSIFSHANLTNSDLRLNEMKGANFSYANLKNADLTEADAQQSTFEHARLDNVSFLRANLSSVDFSHAILDRTDFMYANMAQSIYRPNLVGLPLIASIATTQNFNTVQFYDDTLKGVPLTALKNAYQNLGMRSMERLVTSMVKTEQMHHALASSGTEKIKAMFSYVLFYLSSDYGQSPSRPLLIFFILIILMATPYRFALTRSRNKFKVLISWMPKNKHKQDLVSMPLSKLNTYRNWTAPLYYEWTWKSRLQYEWQQWQSALYFSTLSAFRIGWDDFNVANWIQRMQRRDYKLTGQGRVRTLAGLHALISFYLLVLWALTYFGRPFEW